MIKINNKKDCCGCTACVQRCPKQCIALIEDTEGFLYPKANLQLCINCSLCERVCPIINPLPPRLPMSCYAGINLDEHIRLESSSGGLFTVFAEHIIKEGGVVFGAQFDENWEVRHNYTETLEGLSAFRGSKYTQSRVGDNYSKAEAFLKTGRKVLFSGTPCQIAGLKRYLKKEYENLFTVDFICHGVPSPKIWRAYLKEICRKTIERSGKISLSSISIGRDSVSYIKDVNFRYKITGWKNYSFSLKLDYGMTQGEKKIERFVEPFSENIFMQGFLKNLYLRPSCYNCPAKKGKSRSDITLADFWGIQELYPELDDDRGTSALFLNTYNALVVFDSIKNDKFVCRKVLYNEIVNSNKNYESSCKEPLYRSIFFKKYKKNELLDSLLFEQTLKDRITLKFKRHFKL